MAILWRKNIYINSMPDTKKGEAPKRHFPMDWMNHIIICLATFYSVYAVL